MRTNYYHVRGRPVPVEGKHRKGMTLKDSAALADLENGLWPSTSLKSLVASWPATTRVEETMKYLEAAIDTLKGGCSTLREYGEELLDFLLRADEEQDNEADAGSGDGEVPRSVLWRQEMDALYEVTSELDQRAQAFLKLACQQDPTLQSGHYVFAKWAATTVNDAINILQELRAIERDAGVDELRRQYRERALYFQIRYV